MSSSHTSSITVAKRYASAAFALAGAAKKQAVLVEEMGEMARAILSDAALAAAFSNPLVSRSTKSDMLAKLAAKGDALTLKTLATIAEGGRASDIPAIAKQLEALLADASGEVVADITSARELSAGAQKKLTESLEVATGKKLKLQLHVDASLIGGVVIQLGSLKLDASLSGALDKMRTELLAQTA